MQSQTNGSQNNKSAILTFIIGDPSVRSLNGYQGLRAVGLNPVLSPSMFLKEYPENFSPKRSFLKMRRHLALSEVGCSMAHLNAYKSFLQSQYTVALILEDDASLIEKNGSDFIEILDEIVERERASQKQARVYSFFSKSAVLIELNPLDPFFQVVGFPSEAVAYVLNREAAIKLLDSNKDYDFVADWPSDSKIAFYLSKNNLFTHASGDDKEISLIHADRFQNMMSSKDRLRMGLQYVSFFTYIRNKTYFESCYYYFSNFVWPLLRYRIAVLGSKRIGIGNPNLRRISRLNPIFALARIRHF